MCLKQQQWNWRENSAWTEEFQDVAISCHFYFSLNLVSSSVVSHTILLSRCTHVRVLHVIIPPRRKKMPDPMQFRDVISKNTPVLLVNHFQGMLIMKHVWLLFPKQVFCFWASMSLNVKFFTPEASGLSPFCYCMFASLLYFLQHFPVFSVKKQWDIVLEKQYLYICF